MKNILHVFSIIDTAEAFFDGQFKYLRNFGLSIHLITSPSNRIGVFCERNDTKYSVVEISRSISPFKDIKAVIVICKYIKSENIDIVVGHTPKGALVSMLASFFMGVSQRIYYRHGLIYTNQKGFTRFVLKNEERLVSLLSTKIVSVSPSVANLCIRDKINSLQKQQLIGLGTCGGIDTKDNFNPKILDQERLEKLRLEFEIRKDTFVVGYAGRLCKDKGIVELVEGFNLLSQKYPDKKLKLLLVGQYDFRDILKESIITEINTNPHILRTGWVHYDEIKYYYSLMSVFVLPSYREGFGMSVIEASAMEKPVIVSRSHGCIDAIVENKTGYYINISPDSISTMLVTFFDENLRQQFGREGRTWVCKHFDHSVLWPEIVKIFQ